MLEILELAQEITRDETAIKELIVRILLNVYVLLF